MTKHDKFDDQKVAVAIEATFAEFMKKETYLEYIHSFVAISLCELFGLEG